MVVIVLIIWFHSSVYKPSEIHVIVDALSRLPYITKPTNVFDQTTNASLFYKEFEWLKDIKDFLTTWHIDGTLSLQ
jgi:hypothetical protein